MGIACDLANRPDFNIIKLSVPISVGGINNEFIKLKHYYYDSTIHPKGKSVITVLLDTDYDRWSEAHRNEAFYLPEKEKIAERVCSVVEQVYQETFGKIEKYDVATPTTYERYCNAYRGA